MVRLGSSGDGGLAEMSEFLGPEHVTVLFWLYMSSLIGWSVTLITIY